MRRAIVVVGPQSAGNRMMIAALRRAGCYAPKEENLSPDWEAKTNWGKVFRDHDTLVWSVHPYAQFERDHLDWIVAKCREREYYVQFIVTARDHYCVAQSEIRIGRLPAIDTSLARQRESYIGAILAASRLGVEFIVAPYESLVLEDSDALSRILDWCGLDQKNLDQPLMWEGEPTSVWRNENAKYYKRDA